MEPELQLVSPVAEPHATITASEALAAEVRQAIDALFQRIPRLEMPHPLTAPHVRGARTVSRQFIESMIAAVEQRPELQRLETFDLDEARETLQFNDAFRQIVDRLNTLVASINYTMEARKAKVAFDAMRTYAIAKGMARDPEGAELVPHLENLKRDLARRNVRRAGESADAPQTRSSHLP